MQPRAHTGQPRSHNRAETTRFMGTAVHSEVTNRKKLLPWRQLVLLVKPVSMPVIDTEVQGDSSEIIVESTNLIRKAKWFWVMGVHQGFSLMFPKSERKKT